MKTAHNNPPVVVPPDPNRWLYVAVILIVMATLTATCGGDGDEAITDGVVAGQEA